MIIRFYMEKKKRFKHFNDLLKRTFNQRRRSVFNQGEELMALIR